MNADLASYITMTQTFNRIYDIQKCAEGLQVLATWQEHQSLGRDAASRSDDVVYCYLTPITTHEVLR